MCCRACAFSVCCAPNASSTLRLLSILSVILMLSDSLSLCSLIAEYVTGVIMCMELKPAIAAVMSVLMCVSLLELNSSSSGLLCGVCAVKFMLVP